MKQNKLQMLSIKVNKTDVNIKTFQGREHLVVPIVALVEGVLQGGNSEYPELALAEEFSKAPQGWNGRPVTFNHPKVNGSFVSASASPEVFEQEALGHLFNTQVEGKKLKTEAWIDLSRVANASDAVKAGIARLQDKSSASTVEVSTGLFTVMEEKKGTYNGKDYGGIWREIVPDHLAILEEGVKGACSIEDGCGAPRTNCDCGNSPSNNDAGANKDAGKKDAPYGDVEYADPGYQADKQKRYPIDTAEHIRAAWNYINEAKNAAQYTTSQVADIKAKIVAAWKAKIDPKGPPSVATNENKSEGNFMAKLRSFMKKEAGVEISEDGTVASETQESGHRSNNQESKMKKEQLIAALIASEATQFAEGDKAWLETLSEEQLKKLEPKANTEGEGEGDEDPEGEGDGSDEGADNKANGKGKDKKDMKGYSAADFIKEAPTEMQEVLAEGLRMHNERKQEIVKELKANKRNKFSEQALKAMNLQDLEKLAELAELPSYEGRAGAMSTNAGGNEGDADEKIPEMPLVFERNKAQGGK